MLYRNKDNNLTYFTFSVLFAKYKREEVEIRHVFGPTRYHRKTVERKWHMVNKCKEMEQEYTGNNCTRNLNPP